MAWRTQCTNCSATFNAGEESMGRTIRCPRCKEMTKIPSLPGRRGYPPDERFEPAHSPHRHEEVGHYRERERSSNSAVIWVMAGMGGLMIACLIAVGLLVYSNMNEQKAAALKLEAEKTEALKREADRKDAAQAETNKLLLELAKGNGSANHDSGKGSGSAKKQSDSGDNPLKPAFEPKNTDYSKVLAKAPTPDPVAAPSVLDSAPKNQPPAAQPPAAPVVPPTVPVTPVVVPVTPVAAPVAVAPTPVQPAPAPAIGMVMAPDGLLITKQDWVLQQSDPLDNNPARQGSRCKTVPVQLNTGMVYLIDLKQAPNSPVDPYLRVEDANGRVFVEDDNSGGGQDARILFKPAQNGSFKIVATTAGQNQLGGVQLTVKAFTPKLNDQANGNLQATDPVDPRRPGAHCWAKQIKLDPGKNYLIEMKELQGSAVDPYLRLEDASRQNILAENDNGGGGKSASIFYSSCQNISSFLVATTAGPKQYGAYQLIISELNAPADGSMPNNPAIAGMNPGMPGMNPGMPGMNPGMPRINPGMVGMNPGMPGMPGMNPGMVGMNPGMPGMIPGMNPPLGPNGQPLLGPNGQPYLGPNGQPYLGPNGQPLLGANGQPLLGPNGQQPLLGPNGQAVLGTNGQPLFVGSNGQTLNSNGQPLSSSDKRALDKQLKQLANQGTGSNPTYIATPPTGSGVVIPPKTTSTPVANPPKIPPRKTGWLEREPSNLHPSRNCICQTAHNDSVACLKLRTLATCRTDETA